MAEFRTGTLNISAIKILRGVRQEFVLFPLLFNLYSDKIFKNDEEGTENGI